MPPVGPERPSHTEVALFVVLPHDREAVHVLRVRVDAQPGVHQHPPIRIVDLDDEALRPARIIHEDTVVRVERLVGEQIVRGRQHGITLPEDAI
jgi:hypothetical protein